MVASKSCVEGREGEKERGGEGEEEREREGEGERGERGRRERESHRLYTHAHTHLLCFSTLLKQKRGSIFTFTTPM